MAKPFSIQSPEDIAGQYAGNKQKIAQAMQLGIVDPTAGVLAGMFIDRMRAGQMQEAAQRPTVAQQVMGGVPSAPPSPVVSSPAGGLGATSPAAAPPMAPPMQQPAPEMPMGMSEGGMVGPYASGGGLGSIPIQDTMFDEPSNGGFNEGYGGGGLVAFAKAGSVNGPLTDDEAYDRILRLEGGLGPNGEMRVSSAGAIGPAQLLPSTAPEAARLAGLPWDERRFRTDPAYNTALGKAYYLSRVAARKGDYAKAALDYHSGMGNVDRGKIGPAGQEYLRRFTQSQIPERDTATAGGRLASYDDISQAIDKRLARSPEDEQVRAALRDRAKELASPEYYEKERKADMWQTLAEIGFNMASSKSPFLLQAVGEAAAAAMPGARADKKERKALKDRALNLMVQMGAEDRKEAMEKLKIVTDVWQSGMSADQFKQQMGLKREELTQQATLAREEMKNRTDVAKITSELRADKDFGAILRRTEQKLRDDAFNGRWKTPSGGRPSETDIQYYAAQQAVDTWNKYKATQQGGLGAFDPARQTASSTGERPPWMEYPQP